MGRSVRAVAWATVWAATILLVGVTDARAAEEDDRQWTVVPYFWAFGASLDLAVGDDPVLGADVGFSDLIETLDGGGLVHFERRGPSGGFLVDLMYLDTGNEATIGRGTVLPAPTLLESDLELGVVEGAVFYRPPGRSFDLLFGVRILDLALTLDTTLPNDTTTRRDTDATYTDAFLGLRYDARLGEAWNLMLRGDVATGDTDFTWSAIGTVGYTFGKRDQLGVVAGWKFFDTSIDEARELYDLEIDLALDGPIAGVVFRL